jgi:hypothetical protein
VKEHKMTNANDVSFNSVNPGLWPQGSAPGNVGAALDALAAKPGGSTGGGGDIQNPREAYLSSDIGNDTTGNGTIGEPWLTITKAISFLPSVGFCRLAAGGYGTAGSPVQFVPTQQNIQFEGVHSNFGSQSQVYGGFLGTGNAGRIKLVGLNINHGNVFPAFQWDDVTGRHYMVECGDPGGSSAPFLHATSNARHFAFLIRCDLTSNPAPYNVQLDDLPAGANATLIVEDTGGMRCSVGVGWTIVCNSALADALFEIHAGGSVLWNAPMPDVPITILQNQGQLDAAYNAPTAGYFICVGFAPNPAQIPVGATTGDILSKPAVAPFMGLYRKITYAPAVIVGLVAGIITLYRQTPNGWAVLP